MGCNPTPMQGGILSEVDGNPFNAVGFNPMEFTRRAGMVYLTLRSTRTMSVRDAVTQVIHKQNTNNPYQSNHENH